MIVRVYLSPKTNKINLVLPWSFAYKCIIGYAEKQKCIGGGGLLFFFTMFAYFYNTAPCASSLPLGKKNLPHF